MKLINMDILVGKDGLFSKRGCPGNCQHCNLWTEEGCRVILEAPTVDAVEVVHGQWVKHTVAGEDFFGSPVLHTWACNCSVCGLDGRNETPYCPNCGAKMDFEGET